MVCVQESGGCDESRMRERQTDRQTEKTEYQNSRSEGEE
jgi:hypothetical protein